MDKKRLLKRFSGIIINNERYIAQKDAEYLLSDENEWKEYNKELCKEIVGKLSSIGNYYQNYKGDTCWEFELDNKRCAERAIYIADELINQLKDKYENN